MKPILFTLPFLDMPVYGYGVMLGLTFVINWYFFLALAKKRNLNFKSLVPAMIMAIVFAIIGARIFFILSNLDQDWPLAKMLNLRKGGLVAYGGYIMGISAGLLTFRYHKDRHILRNLDTVAPCLALGLAITRLGCFLRGCCYGMRTENPFGLSFPPESLVAEQHADRGWHLLESGWSTHVIPTQLISSGTGFLLSGLTLWLVIRMAKNEEAAVKAGGKTDPAVGGIFKLRDGHVFAIFVAGYSTYRFIIEFLRDDAGRGTVGLLSTSQFIALLLIVLAAIFSFYWIPRRPYLELKTEPSSRPVRRKKNKGRAKSKKKKR